MSIEQDAGVVAFATQPDPAAHAGRTAAWLGKQMEVALSAVDLSLPQYRVLALLDEGSAMSSALAERLAVRPPSITAVVDGLVTRGLVDRHPGDLDRRRVDLKLTVAGHEVLRVADEATERRLADIAGHLGDAHLVDEAVNGLSLWRRAIAEHHLARRAAQ